MTLCVRERNYLKLTLGKIIHTQLLENKSVKSHYQKQLQRVPALRGFWDLKKTAICEIPDSWTVGDPLLTQKSPTCANISQKPR